MNIVIEHRGVKRGIVGPFNVWMSRADTEELVAQLQARLKDKKWTYGWTYIHEKVNEVSIPNTPPRAWED